MTAVDERDMGGVAATGAAGGADATGGSGPVLVGPPLEGWVRDATGETLVELFERSAAAHADEPAVVYRHGHDRQRWTYADLLERTLDVAAVFERAGIEPGARIVTWSANDPWLVATFFAAWFLGAVIVPLDVGMREDVAVRIGARVRPAVVVAGPEQAESAARLGAPLITLDAASFPARSPGQAGAIVRRPAPDALAEVLFTSGTTSDPKGVVLTHGQMVHNARCILQTAGMHRERGLAIIPLSHMYGQMVPLLYGIATGSTIVFLRPVTPASIAAALRAERITAITVVPALLRLLLDSIEREAARQGRSASLARMRRVALRLPVRARRLVFRGVLAGLGGELRLLSCGGAALTPDLQRGWEAMGVVVVQGYGSTECAAIAGHSRGERRIGTAGPAFTGIEMRIGDGGEILARGPNSMVGYWEDPDATAEVMVGGWVHTGDAGEIIDGGHLVVRGRTRDRIALPNGLKVYPEDVELALREVGGVKAAVVFEVAPGQLGAAIVPRRGGDEDAAIGAGIAAANRTLAPHQRVRRWRRWPEPDLPRTHTLKVRRGPVIEWYLAEEAREPGAADRGGAS